MRVALALSQCGGWWEAGEIDFGEVRIEGVDVWNGEWVRGGGLKDCGGEGGEAGDGVLGGVRGIGGF